MPIFFSTLEDAWGNNNYPIEKRKKKCKPKKSIDPLCELYGKRYSKISKPYLEMENDNEYQNNFENYSKIKNIPEVDNADMSSTRIRNTNKQEYYPLELDEYSSFASVNAIETADDDEYLVNALDKVTNYSNHQQTSNNTLNLTNYDEESESDSETEKEKDLKEIKCKTLKQKESLSLNEKTDTKLLNDTNYLDFGLYISSGIMLIIMMEKILQLGMLMKN
jgi:hypothetical protein